MDLQALLQKLRVRLRGGRPPTGGSVTGPQAPGVGTGGGLYDPVLAAYRMGAISETQGTLSPQSGVPASLRYNVVPAPAQRALYGGGVFPGAVPAAPGTYATYRDMSMDPTFALAIAAANAPVQAAGVGYVAKSGTPDAAVDLVKGQLQPRWYQIVRESLRAREMGFTPMEVVYNPGPPTGFCKLKPLWHDRTEICVDRATGDFVGFKQGGVFLERARCYLYTHNQLCDDYYGRPLHGNGLRAWANWLANTEDGGRLRRRVSGLIIQLHYPPGKTDDGTDNATVAKQILDRVAAGESAAMPNLFDAANTADEQADLAGKSSWVLSTLNVGSSAGDQAVLFDDRRYWDVQKLRAWLVPERAVTEGQYGTKAEAEAHADILLAVAGEEHGNIVRAAQAQLAAPLLTYNGHAPDAVLLKAEPITDERKAVFKQLFTALLANPATLELLLTGDAEMGGGVDLDALLDQLGLPRTPANRALLQPVADAAGQARARQQQAAAGTNGNGNGAAGAAARVAGLYADANAGLDGN